MHPTKNPEKNPSKASTARWISRNQNVAYAVVENENVSRFKYFWSKGTNLSRYLLTTP